MRVLTMMVCIVGITFSATALDKGQQLYEAVVKNDKKKVEKLIKKGVDVNHVVKIGAFMKVSALITAVNNENQEIAKLLLENGANVNWKDGFNTSAILYAASLGNIEMVQLLLDHGADINDQDDNGNTVLVAAKGSKNEALIAFVEKKIVEGKK